MDERRRVSIFKGTKSRDGIHCDMELVGIIDDANNNYHDGLYIGFALLVFMSE